MAKTLIIGQPFGSSRQLSMQFHWSYRSLEIADCVHSCMVNLLMRAILENTFLFAAVFDFVRSRVCGQNQGLDQSSCCFYARNVYGIKAMTKSNALIEHNIGTVVSVFLMLVCFFMVP